MNETQTERMLLDSKQIFKPMETTVIIKHHAFSFISFIIGELRPEIQKLLEDSNNFEEMKAELQVLRLNRVLGHCAFPDDCSEYDFCEKEDCRAKHLKNRIPFD